MIESRHVSLACGNGGRFMRELVEQVFLRHLGAFDGSTDAAHVPLPQGDVMVTTDGFTVQPLEFPGGDIGSLAVHGTVNDLAVCGAIPAYLCLSAFIEEGFELERLERFVVSMAEAARLCGVRIVAGDTKVLRRGEGGGVYFSTTGIGVRRPGLRYGPQHVCDGDVLLVSGPVGDHGTAVLLAREEFGLRGDLASDAASVLPLTRSLHELPGVRFMRDPTRGGLATVAHELARASGLCVRLHGPSIPVRDPVRSVCDMLGFDPLYLACEGRVLAVVAPETAAPALAAWQALPSGRHAAVVGKLHSGRVQVVLETELGGERILQELEDDPLPRIC